GGAAGRGTMWTLVSSWLQHLIGLIKIAARQINGTRKKRKFRDSSINGERMISLERGPLVRTQGRDCVREPGVKFRHIKLDAPPERQFGQRHPPRCIIQAQQNCSKVKMLSPPAIASSVSSQFHVRSFLSTSRSLIASSVRNCSIGGTSYAHS